MFSKFSFSKALLISLSFLISHAANAELTTVGDLVQISVNIPEYEQDGGEINTNDCSGYFGQPFTECKITHVPSEDSQVFATIMGKFDVGTPSESEFTSGSAADDWTFNGGTSNEPEDAKSGSWAYSGTTYPGVSFWVAKGGSEGFILNWMVSQESVNNNLCSVGNEFTIDCLSVSIAVTSGSWVAPDPYNLSHISFYGNKCDNNCDPTPVPEPTSIALFALALLGIAARRKKYTL